MKHNYRSGTKTMTDAQVMTKYLYHCSWIQNDSMSRGGTSHLTKSCYYENELKKRGWTDEMISAEMSTRGFMKLAR